MTTLLFSRKEIAQIVESVGFDQLMDKAIDGMTRALQTFDPAAYSIPVRAGFCYSDESNKGLLEWMPAMRYGDRVVIKIVGYHPDNPLNHHLPTILSTIITFDTRSGHAKSIIDGTFLTSLRTGAASAVASGVLAAPNSKVLGLIGAGAQAVTQLHALSRKFNLEKVLIHDTDMEACNSFAFRSSFAGVSVPVEVRSIDEVLRQSDIICTSTSIDVGSGPLFSDTELKESVHINAVGSDFPNKIELPKSLLKRSLVCPDFLAQAVIEGECQQLQQDDIGPDLATLIKERVAYSKYGDKMTVFDSTGWALEDLVASEIIADLGEAVGCGTAVDLQCVADDPKNPYGFVKSQQVARNQVSLEEVLQA